MTHTLELSRFPAAPFCCGPLIQLWAVAFAASTDPEALVHRLLGLGPTSGAVARIAGESSTQVQVDSLSSATAKPKREKFLVAAAPVNCGSPAGVGSRGSFKLLVARVSQRFPPPPLPGGVFEVDAGSPLKVFGHPAVVFKFG